MLISNSLQIALVLLVLGAFVVQAAKEDILQETNLQDIDRVDDLDADDDKIDADEMETIRRKIDAMSDEELASVLYAVLPHERSKRTIGTVRRCLEKVRCLFGALKRRRAKRNSSPAAILRAISKLTNIASDAANELLGKRFGDALSLSNLFKAPKGSSSAIALSDDSESASSSLLSSSPTLNDEEDVVDDSANLADASEVVEQKTCDQRCHLSVLVFRRLRRLLRHL